MRALVQATRGKCTVSLPYIRRMCLSGVRFVLLVEMYTSVGRQVPVCIGQRFVQIRSTGDRVQATWDRCILSLVCVFRIVACVRGASCVLSRRWVLQSVAKCKRVQACYLYWFAWRVLESRRRGEGTQCPPLIPFAYACAVYGWCW